MSHLIIGHKPEGITMKIKKNIISGVSQLPTVLVENSKIAITMMMISNMSVIGT